MISNRHWKKGFARTIATLAIASLYDHCYYSTTVQYYQSLVVLPSTSAQLHLWSYCNYECSLPCMQWVYKKQGFSCGIQTEYATEPNYGTVRWQVECSKPQSSSSYCICIWFDLELTASNWSVLENVMICAVPDCSLAIWEAVGVAFGCHRRQELECVTLETQNWMCSMRPCCTLPPEIFALLKIPVHIARLW